MDVLEVLNINHIPVENIVLSSLYTYSLYYLTHKNLPTQEEERKIMHIDTRGCLFDFTNKTYDVIFYCNQPIICSHCRETYLIDDRIINKELKKIRKSFFIGYMKIL